MLQHKGTGILETERLILRRLTMDDAEAMFHNWAGDAEVAKYMRWDAHKNIEETGRMLSGMVERYKDLSVYHWAIVLKGTDTPIGVVALICTNEFDMCAEAAYCLGRKYWGQGIVSEALKAVVDFGLLEVGFNRIEAYHAVANPSSGGVMKNVGMKYEGRMRKKYRSHAGFEDSDMYAILREDIVE